MDLNKKNHHHQQQQKLLLKPKRSSRGSKKEGLKVVYISTPMKVKTSASKFRAIVQELTGRESNVVKIMESSGGRDTWTVPDHRVVATPDYHDHDDGVVPPLMMGLDFGPSPSSSEEFVDPLDGLDGVGPLDHSGLLYDQFCHQMDLLGGYYS